jgi:hypothetical protein
MHSARTFLAASMLGLLATACASEATDDSGTESGDSALSNAHEGLTTFDVGDNETYTSVAVYGQKAFIGNTLGEILPINLKTMRGSLSLLGNPARKLANGVIPIPSDSVSVGADVLAACGLKDDSPISAPIGPVTPQQRNYVITLFSAKTGAFSREIRLDMEPRLAIRGANGGVAFGSVPTMTCSLSTDGKSMAVSFANDQAQNEVVSFTLPSAEAATAPIDFQSIPSATRVKVGTINENTIRGFVTDASGVTYAAGGYGVRRVARGSAAPQQLVAGGIGQPWYVGIAASGSRLFAAALAGRDSGPSLAVLNATDGKLVEKVLVPGTPTAVTVAGDYVVVAIQNGIFVTKNKWATATQ